MRPFLVAVALVSLCVLPAACGGSPTDPSRSITGTWTGSITSSLAPGSGPATVTFAQNGQSVTGTWNAVGSNGLSSGTLTGFLNDESLAMTLKPGDIRECSYAVTATVGSSSIAGTYSSIACVGSVSGNLTLTKQ